MKIPSLTRNQAARLDRTVVREGFSARELSYAAAGHIADVMRRYCSQGEQVTVLAGKGHNGGDGIASVMHLANAGLKPTLILAEARRLRPDIREHLRIVKKMEVPILTARHEQEVIEALRASAAVVDALIGYQLAGHPKRPYSDLIYYANAAKKKIVAVDIPSGLDATSGHPAEPTIEAYATVTFGLPKAGLLKPAGAQFAGKLFLADIGIPDYLYRRARVPVPPAGLYHDSRLITYPPA